MEVTDFIYHRPHSISQACALLAELGNDVHLLAGGTEVLVDLKQHTFATRHLISLRDLPALRKVKLDKKGLHVGAMVTHARILHDKVIRKAFPALAEAAGTLAAVQVRNRGTIGGNFCSAVPSADLPPICIAAGARLRLAGPEGERTVATDEFFTGPKQTVRARDEILLEILIPPAAWAPETGACYEKFGLRGASALAVAGAAAWVRMDGEVVRECRIALGAVHPIPLLAGETSAWAEGRRVTRKLLGEAGERASRECVPISDLRGSADYRRDLVRVLTGRALEAACRRAGAEVSS